MHENMSIDEDTGEKCKPSIITFYNSTKGGVDTNDKLCAAHNVARNVQTLACCSIFAMLNMSGINAQIIHFANIDKRI